ncbi:hypothetical protein I552_3346 [Mycobacterium xenopi 3993]|nr:hypothetical protein I552_3346 [Mycobacterium xenopi 3993]
MNVAEAKANSGGAHIVMVGILPTLMPEHLAANWMSDSTRYAALNDSIFNARGEDLQIDISGPEPLSLHYPSIARNLPAPACNCTFRCPPNISPTTGTPHRCWPHHNWRWAPTPPTSSVINFGPKRASSCSPKPPIPAPTS